jgi:hypothetical protein
MPSRQGRLDTTYFSQSQKSTSPRTRNGTQRHSQTQKSNGRGRVERSEEEEDDSEGSEGMNAIRLSESPTRKKLNRKGTEVVDLVSDDEVEEEGKGDRNGNLDTEPKAVASSSRPTHLDLVDNDDEEVEVSPLTTLPTTFGSRRAIPLSASYQPSSVSSVPKKRVDLTSGTLAYPLLPVPTTFTRLGVIPEVQRRRLVPYIELDKWTEEQKSQYTHPDLLETSEQPEIPGELPDNLTAFLGPDMAEIPPIPMSMPTVYDVLDLDEDILPIPPPRKRALLSVEIPRRSQSSQNGSKPSSSSRRQKDAGQQKEGSSVGDRAMRKGKEVAGSSSDGERPAKSSTNGKGKARRERSEEDSEEDRPVRSSNKDKGKGRARVQNEECDDDSNSDRRGPSNKNGKKRSKHSDRRNTKKSKRKEREPSLTRREYLDELELDESTRFKTETRLRKKKETPQQRLLRKLKDKRNGIIRPDTPSEDSEEDSGDESSDSAADSRGLRRSESFIASDNGNEHQVVLPHEFSSNSAQTPEFKFKVVFQYFTLLAVCGTGILPLKGDQKEYFIPQLRDWRRKMEGHKESRVRSQIWPSNYVKALQTYPEVRVSTTSSPLDHADDQTYHLDVPEEHCLACNRANYKSSYRLELRGNPYNPDTYEPLPTAKQKRKIREAKRKAAKKKAKRREEHRRRHSETPSSKGSDSSSDEGTTSEEEDLIRQKDDIFLGPHCRKRSILFHSMAHWGELLYPVR